MRTVSLACAWKRGDVAFIGRNVKHESKNAGKAGDFVIVAIK